MVEFAVDCNATQAALRAGFSARSAAERGYELRQRPDVAQAIEVELARLAAAAEVDAVRLRRELLVIAHSSIDHYTMDIRTGRLVLAPGVPAEAMGAVASVKYRTRVIPRKDEEPIVERTVEFRLWDKPGTLIKLSQKAGVLLAPTNDRGDGERPEVPPVMRVVVERETARPLAARRTAGRQGAPLPTRRP